MMKQENRIKQEDKQIPVSANADVIRELLGETEKKILAFDERIFQVTDLVYEESRTIRTIVNTYGMDLKEVSGINVLVAGAAAKENEEIRNHYEFEPVDDAASFDSDDFVKQLCEKTVGKLGASTPASGEYPVIIERGAFTQLFGAYSSMFCGDAFRKGISPLCGKLNEKIFSEEIEIIDDPNDSRAVQRYAFDDEGCPAKRKTVVEKGVLKSFILDLYASRKTGRPVTKNGGLSAVMEPGETPLKDIIAQVDRRLIVGGFSGGEPGANGEFSGVAKNSFYVEKGRIVGAVTETMINGNIESVFKNVLAVSKEQVWDGYSALPYLACGGIVISGK